MLELSHPAGAPLRKERGRQMNYPTSTAVQQIFQDGEKYYMVEIYPNGKIVLKVKEYGWSDTWSLPVEEKAW